ncbi:MAG: peptidase, partial [Gammaproteobacteria bacterium]|nr:peptidase [Gammaproteobacteria bacterium]
MKTYKLLNIIISITSLLFLNNCGGGGDSIENLILDYDTTDGPTYTAGVYKSDDTFANMCASPRSGVDINGDAFPDQTGSILYENHWLRSWSNDTYLWY